MNDHRWWGHSNTTLHGLTLGANAKYSSKGGQSQVVSTSTSSWGGGRRWWESKGGEGNYIYCHLLQMSHVLSSNTSSINSFWVGVWVLG